MVFIFIIRSGLIESVKKQLKPAVISIIRHPPYSPDLAPSDWVFDFIKSRLGSHTSVESQNRAITKILKNIGANEYKKHLTIG